MTVIGYMCLWLLLDKCLYGCDWTVVSMAVIGHNHEHVPMAVIRYIHVSKIIDTTSFMYVMTINADVKGTLLFRYSLHLSNDRNLNSKNWL